MYMLKEKWPNPDSLMAQAQTISTLFLIGDTKRLNRYIERQRELAVFKIVEENRSDNDLIDHKIKEWAELLFSQIHSMSEQKQKDMAEGWQRQARKIVKEIV